MGKAFAFNINYYVYFINFKNIVSLAYLLYLMLLFVLFLFHATDLLYILVFSKMMLKNGQM